MASKHKSAHGTAKIGRPTKRTPECEAKIASALRLGCSRETASRVADIHPSQLQRWMNADPAFRAMVEKSEEEAVVGWLKCIERAALEGKWQAAAWKLERKRPAEFARPDDRVLAMERQTQALVDLVAETLMAAALPPEKVAELQIRLRTLKAAPLTALSVAREDDGVTSSPPRVARKGSAKRAKAVGEAAPYDAEEDT